MVGLLQPDWIPHDLSPQMQPWAPLSTREHQKTPLNIPQYPRRNPNISPYIPKDETDADACQGTPTDAPSPFKIESGWSHPIIFAQTWKARSFCPTLLRHQNIKTSLCNLSKNGWVMSFFVFFRSVRKKLQFTVFLDHPVALMNPMPVCQFCYRTIFPPFKGFISMISLFQSILKTCAFWVPTLLVRVPIWSPFY